MDSSAPTVMYLDISIPDDTEPGLYNGRINLNIHNGASLTKEVYIEVFPVQLEEQSLLISNWYFPEEFKHMNNGKEVIEGSRKYKKCKKEVLTTAAAYGQNVWLLYEKGNHILMRMEILPLISRRWTRALKKCCHAYR